MEQLIGSLDKLLANLLQYVVKPVSLTIVHITIIMMLSGSQLRISLVHALANTPLIPDASLQLVIDYYGIKPFLLSFILIAFLLFLNIWQTFTINFGRIFPPYVSYTSYGLYIHKMMDYHVVQIRSLGDHIKSANDLAETVDQWERKQSSTSRSENFKYWQSRAKLMELVFTQAKFCFVLIVVFSLVNARLGYPTNKNTVILLLAASISTAVYAVLKAFYAVDQKHSATLMDFTDTLAPVSLESAPPDDLRAELREALKRPRRWWTINLIGAGVVPYSMTSYYSQRIRDLFLNVRKLHRRGKRAVSSSRKAYKAWKRRSRSR